MKNSWKTVWIAMGFVFSLWLIPPIIHDALHLCPIRPDGLPQAGAMPNWARKYGVDCSVCHTTVPSLTRAGYMFRRAGFRMPDEYGADAKFNGLRDLYSTRIREEYRVRQITGGTAPSDTNGFTFHELTFYPITGAFGKWWSAESELTFVPGSEVEVENAYVRATVPHKDWLFTARAGIFHQYEGYGASDRPISNIRPLFQTTATNGVKLWNQDTQGIEAGATYKDTTLTLAIVNGYSTSKGSAIENSGTGTSDDDNNKRDYIVVFNQLIGDKAGFTEEYLNGNTNMASAVNAGHIWNNNWWRSATYANYKVLGDKLDVLGGYEFGRDQVEGPSADAESSFMHNGWFGEFRSKLHEHFTAGFRYDTFKPNRSANDNRIDAFTLTGVLPFDEIKFLIDALVKRTEKAGPTQDQLEKLVRFEWMVIF